MVTRIYVKATNWFIPCGRFNYVSQYISMAYFHLAKSKRIIADTAREVSENVCAAIDSQSKLREVCDIGLGQRTHGRTSQKSEKTLNRRYTSKVERRKENALLKHYRHQNRHHQHHRHRRWVRTSELYCPRLSPVFFSVLVQVVL